MRIEKMAKDKDYGEIDIILQAHAMVMNEIKEVAELLFNKYEGGMSRSTALEASKDYYQFGVLPMKLDPSLRKKAEAEVKKYMAERAKRLAPKQRVSEAQA